MMRTPPTFDDAHNLRQKARAAGLDPNYWYPVEWDERLKPGQVVEVAFWKQSIALFRGADGTLHAIANRCAHRQLKLSHGRVEGCELVCAYHGWKYDGEGRLAAVPHDLFGYDLPKVRIPKFPVRVRYGLIWIFPGDPAEAERRALPQIPELEGQRAWGRCALDFTWRAHHSMIIDNVSDFTHAHLHRKFRPFTDAKLLNYATEGDSVVMRYDAKIGRGRISGRFVDHARIDTNHMTLCYQYPYQWSNTDDEIKHWLFVLPIDERTTRSFFIFFFKELKIPVLNIPLRGRVLQLVLDLSKRWLIRPLLSQDGFAVEAEQDGYEAHWDAQFVELNPVVRAFQEVTVRKWREHLDRPQRSGAAAPVTANA
jgi:phenylpropionate dioxygenase-like ring-hydroxylating dioxygenase large terminal subunit